MARRVEVRIENLVLRGFDPRDRMAIAAAVEGELTRLLRERGVTGLSRSPDIPVVRAPAARFEASASPAEIGGVVARSIYGGLPR